MKPPSRTARVLLLLGSAVVVAAVLTRAPDQHQALSAPPATPLVPRPVEEPVLGRSTSSPTKTQKQTQTSAGVRVEAGVEAPVAPHLPGLAVRVTGPGGAPWSELLASLRFLPDPEFRCTATPQRERFPSLPDDARWPWSPLDRAQWPDADPSWVGHLAPTEAACGFVHLYVRDQFIRTQAVGRGARSVTFELSADDLRARLCGVKVEFRHLLSSVEVHGHLAVARNGTALNELERVEYLEVPIGVHGRVEVFGLRPGWVPVHSLVEGHATWTADPVLAPGEVRDLGKVTLHEPRAISGRVVGDGPCAHRTIELMRLLPDHELGRKRVVESDAQGAFRFDDVDSGSWVVRVVNARVSDRMAGPFKKDNILTRTGLREGMRGGDGPVPRSWGTHWDGYRQTDLPVSADTLVHVRFRGELEVELPLLPIVDVRLHAALSPGEVRTVTITGENQVPFGEVELRHGSSAVVRLWPGRFGFVTRGEGVTPVYRSVRVAEGLRAFDVLAEPPPRVPYSGGTFRR